jgi:kynurenine 3-monooxygenase
VDLTEAVCRLETETSKLNVRGDAVIGVDGAFSALRASMQRNIDNFQYNESYLAHGYKELTIPPAPDGSWQIEKNALHIWPRKSFMMIALPNPDGSFTCTLFWEFEGPRSFATTKADHDVRRFFDEEFPDAVPLMRHSSKISRTTQLARLSRFVARRGITAIGSACSAMRPTRSFHFMVRE